jgi:hypothetical protein
VEGRTWSDPGEPQASLAELGEDAASLVSTCARTSDAGWVGRERRRRDMRSWWTSSSPSSSPTSGGGRHRRPAKVVDASAVGSPDGRADDVRDHYAVTGTPTASDQGAWLEMGTALYACAEMAASVGVRRASLTS